ncbi:MAG: FG-GAP-like repeat-containing protein [Nocardioides sp.]
MPPSKSSFVTLCQQLLALGVVIAALTPAASVISLDVVRESPDAQTGPVVEGELAAYSRAAATPAQVSTAAVDPTVTEYALTAPEGRGKPLPEALSARSKVGALDGPEVTSVPEDVSGYGAVGITWANGEQVAEDDLALSARTRTGDSWSEWVDLEYHDEHGPDPDSAEGRQARPGSEALLVGEVDQVQVRVAAEDELPTDMRLAVIDPGEDEDTAVERPALDTTTMDGTPGDATADHPAADTAEGAGDEGQSDPADQIELQAASGTPKPKIFSRAQWGANESLRNKSSLSYFEVHAGFVHHTVNANDYTRAEVPALLRSIYAYHTQSRGWSDIGYNFLVDRFGRIWEGRYGGIDRPVVGAHTLGYNENSFAMSAIGNFDVKKPSKAMVEAYGALFAWKLSLHGIDASSTRQAVGSSWFPAVNGHRDAGSTACPGRYLYAKLAKIRKLASNAQGGWDGRGLESDLASTAHPDLVVRRERDGRIFVIPTQGMTTLKKSVSAVKGLASNDTTVVSADLTGDDTGDLVVVSASGSAAIRPGNGAGSFGGAVRTEKLFEDRDQVTAVGDLDGDGRNDLVARGQSGQLFTYLGRSGSRFDVSRVGGGWDEYAALIGAGDVNADGRADLVGSDAKGQLWLRAGNGRGGFADAVKIPGKYGKYETITGLGDFDGDGDQDLFARHAKSQNGFVLPSNGDGTFGRALGPVTRVSKVGSVVGAAQLAGDGTPDIVARKGNALVTFPNAGTTETGKPIATGMRARGADLLLNAGDWDRDGHGDVIVRTKKSGVLKLRRGVGDGTFEPAIRLGTFKGVGLLAAVGDMTGDGYPDLMGQPASGGIRIYPGKGVDGFRPSYVAYSRISAGRQVAIGRWDGDGAPDSMFRMGTKLVLFPGNGPGGLTGSKQLGLDLSPYDWVVGVSDLQLNGRPDLLVRQKTSGNLFAIPGTSKGFKARRYLAGGMGAYDLAG